MDNKPKNIQRGIESTNAQSGNDGPLLGRVGKLRDADDTGWSWVRRGAKLVHGAADDSRGWNRKVLVWSLIAFLTTMGVIVGFMIFWLRGHGNLDYSLAPTRAERNVRVVSRFVSPDEDIALDMVKRALANRDVGKVESLFHIGDSSPAAIVEFLTGSAERDGRIDRYIWLSSMDAGGLLMEGVLVTYAGKTPAGERLAFLTPDDRGMWKVDYAAFARASKPPWKDLLEGRVDRAQVRVSMAPDAYFNGPFEDDTQWLCFGMASPESNALLPEGESLLHGYCRAGTAQAKAMAQILAGGTRPLRATLEIARVANAESRQFQITRVVAEDWVVGPRMLDATFD